LSNDDDNDEDDTDDATLSFSWSQYICTVVADGHRLHKTHYFSFF